MTGVMWPRRDLLDLLGIEHPIAGIATPDLVAAMSTRPASFGEIEAAVPALLCTGYSDTAAAAMSKGFPTLTKLYEPEAPFERVSGLVRRQQGSRLSFARTSALAYDRISARWRPLRSSPYG